MVEIFNTHKFLFTINHDGEIKGLKVIFIDRDESEKEIILDRIEIGASTVSCKLFDDKGNRYLVPFIRIREVFKGEELIWDAKDTDMSNVKVIKGYK